MIYSRGQFGQLWNMGNQTPMGVMNPNQQNQALVAGPQPPEQIASAPDTAFMPPSGSMTPPPPIPGGGDDRGPIPGGGTAPAGPKMPQSVPGGFVYPAGDGRNNPNDMRFIPPSLQGQPGRVVMPSAPTSFTPAIAPRMAGAPTNIGQLTSPRNPGQPAQWTPGGFRRPMDASLQRWIAPMQRRAPRQPVMPPPISPPPVAQPPAVAPPAPNIGLPGSPGGGAGGGSFQDGWNSNPSTPPAYREQFFQGN